MSSGQTRDALLLFLARTFGKPFFGDSIDTQTFEDVVAATHITIPDIGSSGEYIYRASTPIGDLTARLKVLHWGEAGSPLLIHHQGGGEHPYDTVARRAFSARNCNFTVVAVEAPFQSSVREINTKFQRLDAYLASMACSVQVTEALIHSSLGQRAGARIVSGYSLGGFVSNRHHMIYNTADAYAPFMAGTRHGDIFLTTIAAGKAANERPGRLREALNFDAAWASRAHPNVFPVLGRYDGLNELSVQQPSYAGTPVEIWDGGHLFGVQHPASVAAKIEQIIARTVRAR